MEPRDVAHLRRFGEIRQIGEGQPQRPLDLSIDRQDDFIAHSVVCLPHVEFQLPAPGVAGALARELERADFGDARVQPDRHGLARAAVVGFEGGLERVELLEFFGVPALEDGADGVVAAGGRAQEPELGRLADDQADLGAGDVGLGAFFHAHRHDAQGLDRRAERPGPPARPFRARRSTIDATPPLIRTPRPRRTWP